MKHSSVLPIETPTVQTAIDPCHRRNERTFTSYSQGSKEAKNKARSRDHMLYHCKKALGTLGTANELPLEDERARDNQLLEHVDEPFRPLVRLFISHQYSVRLGKKLSILFKKLQQIILCPVSCLSDFWKTFN